MCLLHRMVSPCSTPFFSGNHVDGWLGVGRGCSKHRGRGVVWHIGVGCLWPRRSRRSGGRLSERGDEPPGGRLVSLASESTSVVAS
jgi:hypothetical protein